MLQNIRKHSGSWGTRLLLGLIIVSFGVFWGMSDLIRDAGSSTLLAKVGRFKITKASLMHEFRDHWQSLSGHLEAKGMSKSDAAAALAEPGVREQTLLQFFEDMLQRVLIAEEIKRLGITVPDQQLRSIIQNTPIFQDKDGKFDKKLFSALLNHNHISETSYVDRMRNELSTSNLIASLVGALHAPETMVNTMIDYQRDQRQVRWYILNEDAIEKATPAREPTGQEIEKFYENNHPLFTLPETRDVSFVRLSAETFAKTITISDDEAYRSYQAEPGAYTKPEARTITQLFISKKDEFPKVQEELAKGSSLQKIAATLQSPHVRAEKISSIERSQLPKAVADAVFSARKGETTPTLSTAQGWYIFQVDEVRPAVERSFPQVKAAIVTKLALEQARKMVRETAEAMTESFMQGATLSEIAKNHNLTITSLKGLTSQGVLVKTKTQALPDPAESRALGKLAFETQDASDMQKIADDVFAMVHVDHIIPSHLIPLIDARPAVRKEWKLVQRQKDAESLVKNIMTKLDDHPALTALQANERAAMLAGDSNGNVLMSHVGLVENAQFPVPSALKSILKNGYQIQNKDLKRLFTSGKGHFVDIVIKNSDGNSLPLIGHIISPHTAANPSPEQRTALAREVTLSLSSDVLQTYMNALRAIHKVKVYEENLENLLREMKSEASDSL